MANQYAGFLQTAMARVNNPAAALLKPTWNAANHIYWDYVPEDVQSVNNVLNINIPVDPSAYVSDIGFGDAQFTDLAFTQVQLKLDRHPQYGTIVRDFEQINAGASIAASFVAPSIIAVQNYLNNAVASLFTTTNFPVNTPVSGTSSIITMTQFTKALATLADQRVPLDGGDLTCLLPPTPFYALLDASSTGGAPWTQAFIAGNATAEQARQTGEFRSAFGVQFRMDQQMPTTGTVGSRTFTACLFHKYAIAGVSRPLEQPGYAVGFERMQFGNIEMRVMMDYDIKKVGHLMSIDAAFGLKVVRPEMGIIFTIAE